MSAIVPAPIAIGAAPEIPARALQTMRVATLFENPAPSVKMRHKGMHVRYTIRRPKVSESPPAIRGPKASPRTYRLRGSTATSLDTLNVWATPSMPGL
jgi:hypothetical protein